MKEADIFTKPRMAWFEGELVFYLVYTLSYLEGPDRRPDGEGGGVNQSQLKFFKITWPMSRNKPNAPLF
jgi:hypothetical protein